MEPGRKLLLTLRYMATGELYRNSMRWNHRVPHNSISILIREVSTAIFEEYKDEVWTLPSTPEGWREVAEVFSTRWNFHHCVGAVDGKHIALVKPGKSGSTYYNYKRFYSIVLMALADANYCFLWCSVGHPGNSSDAGIFNRSSLKRRLQTNTLGLPPPEPLPNDDRNITFFIIGDDAFPLNPWLMKKFPTRNVTPKERIFNYRISRPRLVVENAFGILANRWRCLTTTMQQHPKTVTTITKGCLTLHNIIRKRQPLQPGEADHVDDQGNVVPGAWRQHVRLTSNRNVVGNQTMRQAKIQRNYLCDYYNAPVGAVPWQQRAVELNRYHQVQAQPQSDADSGSDSDVD